MQYFGYVYLINEKIHREMQYGKNCNYNRQ